MLFISQVKHFAFKQDTQDLELGSKNYPDLQDKQLKELGPLHVMHIGSHLVHCFLSLS